MVNEQSSFLRVSQTLKIACLKLPYGQWPGGVLDKNQGYLGNDNIPRPGITPGLLAQYLFS
jgi:hypothetical protein